MSGGWGVTHTPQKTRFAERACKPDSVPAACATGSDHSSSPAVARGVQQPTRGLRPGRPQTPPYSALLRVGFSLPAVSPRRRCALTAPFHPCHPRSRPREFGGMLSVALSLGSPPLAVSQHAALWSPDFPPRLLRRRGDRPARSANTPRVAPGAVHKGVGMESPVLGVGTEGAFPLLVGWRLAVLETRHPKVIAGRDACPPREEKAP